MELTVPTVCQPGAEEFIIEHMPTWSGGVHNGENVILEQRSS